MDLEKLALDLQKKKTSLSRGSIHHVGLLYFDCRPVVVDLTFLFSHPLHQFFSFFLFYWLANHLIMHGYMYIVCVLAFCESGVAASPFQSLILSPFFRSRCRRKGQKFPIFPEGEKNISNQPTRFSAVVVGKIVSISIGNVVRSPPPRGRSCSTEGNIFGRTI